jgi:hypothetical protein
MIDVATAQTPNADRGSLTRVCSNVGAGQCRVCWLFHNDKVTNACGTSRPHRSGRVSSGDRQPSGSRRRGESDSNGLEWVERISTAPFDLT